MSLARTLQSSSLTSTSNIPRAPSMTVVVLGRLVLKMCHSVDSRFAGGFSCEDLTGAKVGAVQGR